MSKITQNTPTSVTLEFDPNTVWVFEFDTVKSIAGMHLPNKIFSEDEITAVLEVLDRLKTEIRARMKPLPTATGSGLSN